MGMDRHPTEQSALVAIGMLVAGTVAMGLDNRTSVAAALGAAVAPVAGFFLVPRKWRRRGKGSG